MIILTQIPSRDDEVINLKEYYKQIKLDINQTNQKIKEYSQDIANSRGEKEEIGNVMVTKKKLSSVTEKSEDLNDLLPEAYFGELIFVDKENKRQHCYIGKIPFNSKQSNVRIYSMHAPFARMFRSLKGVYTAEGIEYTTDLQLVRHLDVFHDKLENISDSLNVGSTAQPLDTEGYLKRQLEKSGSKRRERVYTTLQEEQFDAIQVSPLKNLVIKGGAGVGKTIVLLHRINYLIYEVNDKSEDILFVGPNRLFLDQVSNILPDLAVNRVKQISLEELVKEILYPVIDFKQKLDTINPFEISKRNEHKDAIRYKARVGIESDLKLLIDKAIRFHLITLGDYKDTIRKISVGNDEIIHYYNENIAGKSLSYEDKLSRIYKFLFDQLTTKAAQLVREGVFDYEKAGLLGPYANAKERTAWEKSNVHLQQVKKFVAMPKAEELFRTTLLPSYFSQYTALLNFLNNEKNPSFSMMSLVDKLFTLEDLGCIFYLYLEFFKPSPIYKYIMVDEAQYLSPIWIKCFQAMLKDNGRLNICGDMNQKTSYSATDNWEELTKYLTDVECVDLYKNYRTTEEIIDVAKKVLKKVRPDIASRIKGAGRHGKLVERFDCQKNNIEKAFVVATKILDFEKATQQDLPLIKTVGIISPTYETNRTLEQATREILSNDIDGSQIQISFLPISIAGGLEFDAVIVTDFDYYRLDNLDEASMLYTAVTRAAHELILIRN